MSKEELEIKEANELRAKLGLKPLKPWKTSRKRWSFLYLSVELLSSSYWNVLTILCSTFHLQSSLVRDENWRVLSTEVRLALTKKIHDWFILLRAIEIRISHNQLWDRLLHIKQKRILELLKNISLISHYFNNIRNAGLFLYFIVFVSVAQKGVLLTFFMT